MRFTQFIIFFSLISVLQSCLGDKPGYWKNEQINSGKRSDFHTLNEQVLAALKANDPNKLGSYESQELIQDTYTNRKVELLSNSLNSGNYVLYNEYYAVNNYKNYDTIKDVDPHAKNYMLVYPAAAREMYITMFLPQTGVDKDLITIVYAKYNYGWKIFSLDQAPFFLNGKTAPELYKLAVEKYSKNYLVDAVNDMSLANSCMRPAEIWQYPADTSIGSFYSKVTYEANKQYRFPFILQHVPTHPRIIRIFNQSAMDGYYPGVYYLSSIKLKDTAALRKENNNIKKVIASLIPGIDKDKKYIIYTVFNEMPNSLKSVDRYEIDDKLQ